MDDTATAQAAELGRLCKLHGYATQDVADVFGVTRVTVYNWIAGRTVPREPTLTKLKELVQRLKELPTPQPVFDDIE